VTWTLALEPVLWTAFASARAVGLFAAAPLLGHRALPARIRVLLALAVTWALAPAAPDIQAGPTPLATGLALAGEGLTGAALGFGARILFAGFEVFGEHVSMEGGLGAARVLNPASGASTVALAQVFNVFGLLIFLAIGGHHQMVQALALSFEALPPGAPPPIEGFGGLVLLMGDAFEIAFRLAAPVTVTIFVQNVAFGVMARAIPQLNLMVVQLPAHVALLLLVSGLGAAPLLHAMKDALEVWPGRVAGVLLGGG